MTPREYIAIARGHPCVVPSFEDNSNPPNTNILAGCPYVLCKTIDKGGQIYRIFFSVTLLFKQLKALVASARKAASVDKSSKASVIAWIRASIPAACPAQRLYVPAAI